MDSSSCSASPRQNIHPQMQTAIANSKYRSTKTSDLEDAEFVRSINQWKERLAKQRRRVQNRASQRAFRARKDFYVRNLEQQLDELIKKHRELCNSAAGQADEVKMLRARVTDLNGELEHLKMNQSWSDFPLEFSVFGDQNH